ncbi:hypothetical protein POUND7_015052 [Theobroma cacao]
MVTVFRNSLSCQANRVAAVVMLLLLSSACQAKLSSTFYEKSCPNALSTIRKPIRTAIARERRMAASLIRLHFHDCFVQVGGPSWTVKLGRRDSTTASPCLACSDLPRPNDSLKRLISRFRAKGLSARDMVALSGAHTIGQAQCFTFQERIYSNGSNIDAGFASKRRLRCPATPGDGVVVVEQLSNAVLGGGGIQVSQLVGISSWSSRIRVESLNAEGVVGCLVANLVHKLCWAAAGGCKGWGEDVTRER